MPKKILLFEIRLDEDILVLRGETTEAAGVQLSGKVVLSVNEPLSVRNLSIKVNAIQRFRIPEVGTGPWGPVVKDFKWDQVIFSRRQVFPQLEKTIIPTGNHEYSFSWILPGSIPESVEGFNQAGILWDLDCHMERGYLSSDHHAKKHFRVVRTLLNTSLEFSQMMSVENTWPDKVEYSISIPSKAVVFGSSIPVDIRLSPLLKGLTIGKITISLKELHVFTPRLTKEKTNTRQICEIEFPGFDEPPTEEDDGQWVLKERFHLPRSLGKCLQDCEVESIKVRHKLKFAVQLKNPDGHVSELRATLPVMFYISQNYLVNEQNEVPEYTANVTTESETAAPPRYEESKLDRLYADIDMNMYASPEHSPRVLSRSGSAENLTTEGHHEHHEGIPTITSIQSVQSGLQSISSASGTASPQLSPDPSTSRSSHVSAGPSNIPHIMTSHGHADLVARLQQAHQRPSNWSRSQSLNAIANSYPGTTPPSGRQSPTMDSPANGSQLSSSPASAMDVEEMSKVPSYTTAMRTPARNLSFEVTPIYERVSSAAPSRVGSTTNLADMLRSHPPLSRSSSASGRSANGSTFEHDEQVSRKSTSRPPSLFSASWRG